MAFSELKVGDVMSREVQTVGRNDELGVADKRMSEQRIRHLVVLDSDDEVCAVLSQRDFFRGALLRSLGYGSRAEDALMRQVVVKEAMSGSLHTTTPETLIVDAAKTLLEKKIGCLPVIEAGKLVGIVTETDLVRLVAQAK